MTFDFGTNPDKTLYQDFRDILRLCKDVDKFIVYKKKHFWSIFDTTEFRISKKGDRWTRLFFYTGGYLDKDNLKDTQDLYKYLIHPFKDLRGNISKFSFKTNNRDKSTLEGPDTFSMWSSEIETPEDKKDCLDDFYRKFNAKPHKLLLSKKGSTNTNKFKSIELADIFTKTYDESGYTGLTMENKRTSLTIDVDKNLTLKLDIQDPTHHDINAIEKMFNSNSEKALAEYRKWTIKSSLWHSLFYFGRHDTLNSKLTSDPNSPDRSKYQTSE